MDKNRESEKIKELEALYNTNRKIFFKQTLPVYVVLIILSVVLFVLAENKLFDSYHVSIPYILQGISVLVLVLSVLHIIEIFSGLVRLKDLIEMKSWIGSYDK